jgi:hypothetical protein
MHDPSTLAWEIKSPFLTKTNDKHSYRKALVKIWHIDPQTDGSDNSCGWSTPKLTNEQLKECKRITSDLVCDSFNKLERPPDSYRDKYKAKNAHNTVYTAYIQVGWRLFRKRNLSRKHLDNLMGLMFHSWDSLRMEGEVDMFDIERLVICTARSFAKIQRPWWKEPKFHVHHFEIQIPFLSSFKRWAFSRCCKCGKRFKWNDCVCSDQWDSEGPRWFKGEKSIYHCKCGGIEAVATTGK